jgi:hypothetical protein
MVSVMAAIDLGQVLSKQIQHHFALRCEATVEDGWWTPTRKMTSPRPPGLCASNGDNLPPILLFSRCFSFDAEEVVNTNFLLILLGVLPAGCRETPRLRCHEGNPSFRACTKGKSKW